MKQFRLLATLLCSIVVVMALNAQQNYTIIVSLDGFRNDYTAMYNTPFFQSMAESGVSAVMMPSFPSKTFPNHYTLATGLVPDHHGIVANSFLDRQQGKYYLLSDSLSRNDASFYGGEPIWITAKRQGVKTATIYWVASDVALPGGMPDYWWKYNTKSLLTFEQRIDTAIGLLKKPEHERPHLIMLYFEQPDEVGHRCSPYSPETAKVVQHLDSLIHLLSVRISALPIADKVNLIVTSDHGMAPVSPDRTVAVKQYLKDEWIERVDGNLPGQIYCRPGCVDNVVEALSNVPHLRAWKREEIPAYLNYGSSTRVGDVVALPDVGWLFTDDTSFAPGGAHGFDPTASDMHVMFRAIGPDFRHGYAKPQKFANTCIYPLLAHLLGITPAPCDGSLSEVSDMLAR